MNLSIAAFALRPNPPSPPYKKTCRANSKAGTTPSAHCHWHRRQAAGGKRRRWEGKKQHRLTDSSTVAVEWSPNLIHGLDILRNDHDANFPDDHTYHARAACFVILGRISMADTSSGPDRPRGRGGPREVVTQRGQFLQVFLSHSQLLASVIHANKCHA